MIDEEINYNDSILQSKIYLLTLRSQIEGYTHFIKFQEIFHLTNWYLSLPIY